jgi:serine/threonine protein kinase
MKLLDFGLAKAMVPPVPGDGPGELETATAVAPLTAKGTWLGTAPYMAPEQIQGRPADARSDVFALGAVLYEMATGHRAFGGRTTAEIASAVVHQDPPAISSEHVPVPAAFDRLVRECLAKDPEQRWQTAHDVSLQLAAIGHRAARVVAPRPPPDAGTRPHRAAVAATAEWRVRLLGRYREVRVVARRYPVGVPRDRCQRGTPCVDAVADVDRGEADRGHRVS